MIVSVSKIAKRIIIGIDPGLHNTGWGVISHESNKSSFIASGTIVTSPKAEMPERLKKIAQEISKVIKTYNPHEVSIEETFVNKNNLSSLKLGHARGAIIVTIALNDIKIWEYSATNVKKTIVGKGRAEKQQVEMMVKILLPKATPKTEHEADALAIALTHANSTHNFY